LIDKAPVQLVVLYMRPTHQACGSRPLKYRVLGEPLLGVMSLCNTRATGSGGERGGLYFEEFA